MSRAPLERAPTGGPHSPFDSEEGRLLLQERLAFFMKVGFFISSAFILAGVVVSRWYAPSTVSHLLSTLPPAIIALVTWLACRRGRHPAGRLRLFDAGAMFLICLTAGSQTPFVPLSWSAQWLSSLSHQFTEWLVARAAIVPSSPRRTFLVSLASLAAGLLGFVLLAERTARPGMGSFGRDLLWAGMWGAGALAIATLVSWVIYGLRKEVREARRLGQYLLEDKVGEGGMGTVYRARHALLKRPTAVKLLRPERMGAETIERFEREVQLTAGLSHPNTVSIFDYGRTADGVFYYAMEYLDGLDLESLVRADGPQPPARVASILSQVAAALGEAHAIGLVHRDIKPANIILCERGGVPDVAKVVDFGLVRELGTDAGQTNLQVLKGTPLYMAPEAFSAPETVDGRSDLYALGAVGYYLLAGRPVFEGRTIGEVCGHHLHTEPVPPSLRLGRPLPEALESIVMSCLRKDPSLRPTSAGDLRRALQRYGETDGWSEDDAREWWRAWNARDHGLNLTSSETPTFVLEPAGRF